VIKFPCKCGHAFNLTEDQAGGLVQCPRCGLLVDVPTLSDLANMNADGTFGFSQHNVATDNTTAADLHRVFTNKTVDSQGREKDLRPTAERFASIGLDQATTPRAAPRYDPVTGELIQPLQFKDETPVPVLSIAEVVDPAELTPEELAAVARAATPATAPRAVIPLPPVARPPVRSLAYAVGDTRKQVTLKTLALELLMPANTIVMFFVFLFYVAGHFITIGLASYTERFLQMVWPFLIVNVPIYLTLAHLGCVIEETGPNAVDELPRPLRNFEFGDDMITPFFRVMLAILICFVPGILLYRNLDPANPMTLPIVLTFGLVGAYLFPAVVLTTVAGTTVLNLRPDRVMGVIRQAGLAYPISVLLFLLTAVLSVYYVPGELLFRLMLVGPICGRLNAPTLMLPLILVAVYLLHFFAWHLGLIYRNNHEQFPWLAQRHVKTDRSKQPVSRAAIRR
jgi:hypothetical protein